MMNGGSGTAKQLWALLIGILLGVLLSRAVNVNKNVLGGFLQQEWDLPANVVEPTTTPTKPEEEPSIVRDESSIADDAASSHSFCRQYIPPSASAALLWKSHKDRILRATKHKLAGPNAEPAPLSYPEWLPNLYELLSTRYLRQAYQQAPSSSTMEQILNIIVNAKQSDGPPLEIAVLGGSVTQGRESCVDPVAKKYKKKIPLNHKSMACNWPRRLQVILDEFLGVNITKVTNLAVGGTSTTLSTSIVKYRLFYTSEKNKRYDVIINAYSTNDALPTKANHTYDMDFMHKRFEMSQKFIQACQQSRPCSPNLPLVLYVDDYIGNQHNLILAEQLNGWILQHVSQWTSTMLISYAAAARRFVYANQWETLLTGYWPWWSDRKEPPRINVHFGISGHMGVAWTVAYGMLSAVIDFCHDDYNATAAAQLFPQWFPPIIMELMNDVPPPKLDANLTIEQVSDAWLTKSKELELGRSQDQTCASSSSVNPSDEETMENPCALSFVCGPAGTIRQADSLGRYIKYATKDTRGWQVDDQISEGGWTNKLGYVAIEPNASTTFFVQNTSVKVRAIKVYYLRSYGKKWYGSKAKFTLRGGGGGRGRSHKFELKAYHSSNTSISYEHELDLGSKYEFPVGSNVELQVDVVSGSSFKITGLVMCNRP